MKTRTLKQLVLYNYRYIFGYLIVFLFSIYFLGWRLGSLVPGLAPLEIVTAAANTNLGSLARTPVAPLHSLLQYASFQIFDITSFSVRLPGVLISGATVIVLYFLLKKWFGRPTALMSSALLISADWFLFIARLGTGGMEFGFWLSIGLLSLTKILERKRSWLIVLALSIVGLLFTPFGPYAALTLISSLLGFKVFRSRMHEINATIKAISYLVVLLGVAGVVALSYFNINFIKQLLVIETVPTIKQFLINMVTNASSVVAILPHANPAVSPSSFAMIRFFELIFVMFGITMLFKTRVNRLNLMIIVLSTVLFIVSGLSDTSYALGLFIVPSAIFMTAGIRHLIHRWKRMFPNNPYARIVAYVPLAVLFLCVVGVHYVTYFKLWANQTKTQQTFSTDYLLAHTELNRKQKKEGSTCYVESDDKYLQVLLTEAKSSCTDVQFNKNSLNTLTLDSVIMIRPDSPLKSSYKHLGERPLVSSMSEDNIRWLVVETARN
jgi:hypothetical protein